MSQQNLPESARVVVIGGGIIGCSVAHHRESTLVPVTFSVPAGLRLFIRIVVSAHDSVRDIVNPLSRSFLHQLSGSSRKA